MARLRCASRLLVLVALALLSKSDAAESPLRLTGILSTASEKLVLIEDEQAQSPDPQFSILGERQRQKQLSVLAIDPQAGSVRARYQGEETELRLGSGPAAADPVLTLRLDRAGLEPVLRLYQRLSKQTLLRAGGLPRIDLDLVSSARSDADLTRAMEAGLAVKGILIRSGREHFAIAAGRELDFASVSPQLWDLACSIWPTGEAKGPADEGQDQQRLPAGTIHFVQADVNQVLQVFQELAGRTVLRPTTLPAPGISLTTATPLARTETVYAFVALFALNGLSVRCVGDQFLLVYPTRDSNKVTAVLGRQRQGALSAGAMDSPVPQGTLKLSNASLKQVAAIYQQLSGQPVEVAPAAETVRVVMQTQTNLSRDQALYGLDLLLGLNNLELAPKESGAGLMIVPVR